MSARYLIALALVAVAVTAFPTSDLSESDYETMWQGFVSDFKKTYHPSEVMGRYKIFKVCVNQSSIPM